MICASAEGVAPVSEQALVSKYVEASAQQRFALRGASMELNIAADVPSLDRHGRLRALRRMSNIGKITYEMLGFTGDNGVKKEVIARFLSSDAEAQESSAYAISQTNYKFKFKRVQDLNGRQVYVLSLSPRKKEVGLFKGELWLDAETCMPVREAGRFVKSPSLFLKRIEFVRWYHLQDGVAVPERIESRINTRVFGQVTLNVDFGQVSHTQEETTASPAGATASSPYNP